MTHNAGQPSDTKPDQVTNCQPSLPTNIDGKDVDSKDNKVDTNIDLNGADIRRTPDTQGSNLPKLTQVTITNVLQVKFALAQLRLEHLINSSVPRPAKGQHNYNRWVQWSRTVANWLYLQVDETIQERLQQRRNISSKADALFDRIMKMVRESDNAVNLSAKINNYDSKTRSDFGAVRKYIAVHQSQYHLLGSKLLPVSSLC
ncbi:hypothetical protein N7517_001000 [Penicillium concentricum]|uniref:Uncharacterized protein n=1 Tax=Penicillium concentricum TaxID=293559 RepID=A0A9W9ST85_9EURO|nr:uncharacterized protein N7517_001000 [Penicillium concentricum]KAJ5383089.1 hypothetical protein N7517_001000 [Penicillium concentricum]